MKLLKESTSSVPQGEAMTQALRVHPFRVLGQMPSMLSECQILPRHLLALLDHPSLPRLHCITTFPDVSATRASTPRHVYVHMNKSVVPYKYNYRRTSVGLPYGTSTVVRNMSNKRKEDLSSKLQK